jgi:hypothetical protein
MKSYKQWKMINESFLTGMTLGVTTPQALGGLRSNIPLSEKKKMDGKVVVDDKDLGDDHEDDAAEDMDDDHDDEGGCSCNKKGDKEVAFAKKNMKKKMKKKMEDSDEEKDGEEDDVNDVETPNSSDEGDAEEGDNDDDDGGEDHDDDEGDDEKDAAKYGFMKDKKDKKKKKKEKVDEQFWNDIQSYHVPKTSDETDKEFFDSLARQYGNPQKERYSSGVHGDGINEDLLLTPDQWNLINSMPKPGEIGFSPNQRLGGGFAQSEEPELETLPYGESYEEQTEDNSDFEVLCKYFTEDVARGLVEKRRDR